MHTHANAYAVAYGTSETMDRGRQIGRQAGRCINSCQRFRAQDDSNPTEPHPNFNRHESGVGIESDSEEEEPEKEQEVEQERPSPIRSPNRRSPGSPWRPRRSPHRGKAPASASPAGIAALARARDPRGSPRGSREGVLFPVSTSPSIHLVAEVSPPVQTRCPGTAVELATFRSRRPRPLWRTAAL